jgi:hypothetical protein
MAVSFYKRRTGRALISVVDSSGNKIRIFDTNHIRVKIGRSGLRPILDLNDEVATSNGSYVTNENPILLHIDSADLVFPAGIYDIQVSVLDNLDAENMSFLSRGRFILHNSVSGTG